MTFDAKVPPTLLDLQKWFGQFIARPLVDLGEFNLPIYISETARDIEQWITPGPTLSAAERMGIYHQQFWFRLLNLLQEIFPSLTRLFGYKDFNELIAEPYLLKYFPDHWAISVAARKLPQWIEEEYSDEDKVLVHQIALIDEAYDRLYYEKNEIKPIERKLFLQPTIELFALDGDLFSFRKALLEKEPDAWLEEELPKIDWSRKRWYTLSLVKFVSIYEEISEEEYLLLKAFQRGSTIDDACQLIEERDVEAHIAQWFQKWTQKQWLFSLS